MSVLKYRDKNSGQFVPIPQILTVSKEDILEAVYEANGDNIYYFAEDGDDTNNGKSANTPKKNFVDYINSGNTLLFKAGDTFTLDTYMIIKDKQNITISSYGEGKAKFTGLHTSDNVFVATDISNLYSIQFNKDVDAGYITIGDNEIKNWKRLSTNPTTYNEGEWYFDRVNHMLYYYSSVSVEGKHIQYSLGSKGIVVVNSSNIVIDNIELCDFAYHGISLENNVSYVHIINNEIHDIGGGFDTQVVRYGNAVQLWLSNEHDIYVENNVIHDVFDTGITPQGTDGIEDCYNLYIRKNDIRRCAFMLEFFNSTATITTTVHFEDNFCYQVKDISDGYRTAGDYTYTHLSFILVWNSANDGDKIYFKNNICIESNYCAIAFSQNTVRDKLIFENNLFICEPNEAIHNSYVLDELPEIISIRNSGLTEDEVNALIDAKLNIYEPKISADVINKAISDYIAENPLSSGSIEKLERVYFNVDGGQYWNTSGELIEYLTKVSATSLDQLISVSEGEKYRVSLGGIWVGTNPAQVVFFDSNKSFVSVAFNNANVTAKEFTVPSGVSYMGISVWSGVEPILYRVSVLASYSEDKIREEHLTRMKHEQNIQHTVNVPYYKTPTKPYITFVHDDCRSVFDVLAQHFINRNIPLCVATPPNAITMTASVGDLSMREVLDNVVDAGGEVLVHHANQMTQEMLNDYDICFEHFVNAKKTLEDYGYDINGIILAGGTGQVIGSPISDMWVRSYYLYSDLYGESEYAEPYYHARHSLLNLGDFDGAKTRIQSAINNNEWLVMYTHDWNDFSEDNLTQLLDWINEQDISVYTYKQVYDELISYSGIVENTPSVGTTNYSDLNNKPSINGVELFGDKTTSDLGIVVDVDETVVQTVVEEYLLTNPILDSLSGKRILCVGDSICEGVGANNKPYAYWLQQWHPNTEIINLGVGGMTIAQKDETITNSMPVRIANKEFEADIYNNIDIVVFEGGINDLMNNVKLGYISKNYNTTRYITFCQGMEYMFSYFKDLYPTSRMIFISTHNVSAYDYNKSQAWWGAASEICAKWGVEFLDLFSLMCTHKISGLQLHPDYTVHRDYYAKYLNMALVSSNPLAGARTTNYYKHNVPCMLTYYSGTKLFNIGDTISTSDWRINMIRADLTTYVNVSSSVVYDTSEVDTTMAGIYPVHVAYTEDGITVSVDVDVTISDSGSIAKVLDSISATKMVTTYNIGDAVSTDDITVTATYSDGSTIIVTNGIAIDTSNINNTEAGEYAISVSYTENSVVKTTHIQITIIDSDSGNTTDWDDSATIEQAWATEGGIFDSIKISGDSTNFVEGQSYDVLCKLMVESNLTTKGQIALRFGGESIDLGEVTFGKIIEVNEQLEANSSWTVDTSILTTNVYTTSGSGFPWTVYIKDFTVGAVNTLYSISATKTTTSYNVGDTVMIDDIIVTATYSNGSIANVTDSATIDTSSVNSDMEGIYSISVSYTEDSVTKTTTIPIIIGNGGETNWDDSTTVTAAWKTTEGIFENTIITDKYTSGTVYNVSCKLLVESDSTSSGQVVLRIGGMTSDLGTIAFGEIIDVNIQMTSNANWTIGNMQPNVYTTSGSGFPWTVHIKDFAITEM